MTDNEIMEAIFGNDQSSGEDQSPGEKISGKDKPDDAEKAVTEEDVQAASGTEINTGIRIISSSDRGDELLRRAFGII